MSATRLFQDLTHMLDSNRASIVKLETLRTHYRTAKSQHKKEVLQTIDQLYAAPEATLDQCFLDLFKIEKLIVNGLELYQRNTGMSIGGQNVASSLCTEQTSAAQIIKMAQQIATEVENRNIQKTLLELGVPKKIRIGFEGESASDKSKSTELNLLAGSVECFAKALEIQYDSTISSLQLLTKIKQKVLQEKQMTSQALLRLASQYQQLFNRTSHASQIASRTDQVEQDYQFLVEQYSKLKALRTELLDEVKTSNQNSYTETIRKYEQEIESLSLHKELQADVIKQLTAEIEALKNQNFEMKMLRLSLKAGERRLLHTQKSEKPSKTSEESARSRILWELREHPQPPYSRDNPECVGSLRQQIEYKKQQFSSKVRMLLNKYS